MLVASEERGVHEMPSLEQVSKGSPEMMLMVLTLMPMLFRGGGEYSAGCVNPPVLLVG